jgi:hypothetical protein
MYLFLNTTGQIAHCPPNFSVCYLIMGHQLPSARHDKLKESLNKLRRTKAPKTRGAGGSIKPGVEHSGTPGSVEIRNEPVKRAAAASLWVSRYWLTSWYLIARQSTLSGRLVLSPVSRARLSCLFGSWGSASLHPRLYAAARSAGQPKLCAHEPGFRASFGLSLP